MRAGIWNLVIEQGADETFVLTWTIESTGAAVDITGFKFYWTAKEKKTDSTYIINISTEADTGIGTITLSDAENGEITLYLPSAITSAYTFTSLYHNVKFIDTLSEEHRLLEGQIKLSTEV